MTIFMTVFIFPDIVFFILKLKKKAAYHGDSVIYERQYYV